MADDLWNNVFDQLSWLDPDDRKATTIAIQRLVEICEQVDRLDLSCARVPAATFATRVGSLRLVADFVDLRHEAWMALDSKVGDLFGVLNGLFLYRDDESQSQRVVCRVNVDQLSLPSPLKLCETGWVEDEWIVLLQALQRQYKVLHKDMLTANLECVAIAIDLCVRGMWLTTVLLQVLTVIEVAEWNHRV